MKLKNLIEALGALRYGVKWVVSSVVSLELGILLDLSWICWIVRTRQLPPPKGAIIMGSLCLGECSANIKIPVT